MSTSVFCENIKCIYCDQKNWECSREIIRVGECYPDGCEDFISYTDTAEYRESYFACIREGGFTAKAEKRGKLIRIAELCFYTSDRIRTDLECYLTEEKTGYMVGTLRELVENPDRLEQIREKVKELPDVKTFPLAVWEKTDKLFGHYVLVETPEETEGAEE